MDALAQLALYESDALREIAAATDAAGIEAVRIQFLGKKQGRLKDLQSLLGQVEVSERPALGKRFNEVKDRVTAALEARQAELAQPTKVVDGLDVTLPGTPFRMGHRHPISQTIEEFKSIMVRLGFDAVDGPEIEDEFHNFEALNIPLDHP
ncbi:MAG: phenylalanine--tRNA ligase subunit alpha, partial [Planctomycetota bacterium]